MGGDGGARTELGLRAGARLAMRQEERVALGGTVGGWAGWVVSAERCLRSEGVNECLILSSC